MRVLSVVLVLLIVLAGCGDKAETSAVKNVGVQSIEIKGSDTLVQLSSNLAEAFSEENPEIRISVTGGGSGTGIASLLNGETDIASSSREIKQEELKMAYEKGLKPVEVIMARDMLSVIVNEKNPVRKLTVEQISGIYKGEIKNWKELGGEDKEITLYGRQSTSGTYVFFMEHIVKGDYSPKMRNMEGNQAILESVKQDESAIGYVGVGYLIDEQAVRKGIGVVEVAKDGNSEFISPLAGSSDYPISRPLFQYLANKPSEGSPIHKLVLFELSEEGQKIVKSSGFETLTSKEESKNKEALKGLT